jgi:dTDP-glucose 4,6-dehydratase
MSRIIVTGGLGFIGSEFVNYVMNNTDHEVVVLDKMTYAANIDNIKQPFHLIKKDICKVTQDDLGDYDYIVNFAAETHVDNSILNGRPFVETNVMGTFNLLELARKNNKLKKFLQISTDEVYGDMEDNDENNRISTEEFPMKASSYYSATKVSSDMLVISANRTYGLPYLITRTCNNFGEHQNNEKFIPKIISSIKNGVEVPVYGDGSQVREWIHASDNVKQIYKLLVSDVVNEVYNIGSGERYQNIDIINMIGNILGTDVKYKFVEDRLGHDKRYSLSSNKFRNTFGEYECIKLHKWLEEIIVK